MQQLLMGLSLFLIILSILPFIKNQHWVFRVPEFMKIQILVLQIITTLISFIFIPKTITFWVVNSLQIVLIGYHFYLLIRYTKFYRRNKVMDGKFNKNSVTIISSNVYQFNTKFDKFHQMIQKYQPDIFVTMESNSDWEEANKSLEKEYPHTVKVTLENTYGMHLYSKIPIEKSKIHYFVADDLPSIEAYFKDSKNSSFCIFSVHPPPPSPTEEVNSKERDGDLLSVAKSVKKSKIPTVVIGDFNTVAWSKTSILFRKTSELIDARIGRGILSTFHAKYWFFRVPLDLLFHSTDVFIEKLNTLYNIGSDHFPIYCKFHINTENKIQEKEIKTLTEEEAEEVEEIIQEGIEEESENREEIAS